MSSAQACLEHCFRAAAACALLDQLAMTNARMLCSQGGSEDCLRSKAAIKPYRHCQYR